MGMGRIEAYIGTQVGLTDREVADNAMRQDIADEVAALTASDEDTDQAAVDVGSLVSGGSVGVFTTEAQLGAEVGNALLSWKRVMKLG